MAVPKNLNLVGPQLKKLRDERQWTQNRLSKTVRSMGWHVTRDILAQMEATQKRITDCDLVFLAKALNVEVMDFFPASFTPGTVRAKIQSPRLTRWQSKTNGFRHGRRLKNGSPKAKDL